MPQIGLRFKVLQLCLILSLRPSRTQLVKMCVLECLVTLNFHLLFLSLVCLRNSWVFLEILINFQFSNHFSPAFFLFSIIFCGFEWTNIRNFHKWHSKVTRWPSGFLILFWERVAKEFLDTLKNFSLLYSKPLTKLVISSSHLYNLFLLLWASWGGLGL